MLNAIDLSLADKDEPPETLLDMDIASALSLALANRPELEATKQQLAADALSIRLAHNNLRPDLELSGFYSPTGLGGNAYDISTVPPTLLSTSGLGDSLSQLFGFKYPTYSASLTLPIAHQESLRGSQSGGCGSFPTHRPISGSAHGTVRNTGSEGMLCTCWNKRKCPCRPQKFLTTWRKRVFRQNNGNIN